MEVFNIDQNNTYKVSFDLVDENDTAVPVTSVGSLLLTLYYYNSDLGSSDRYHLATINNRYQQDVKNVNNVTMNSNGNVVWYMQPDDNQKLDTSTEEEVHTALFKWKWDSGTKQNTLQIFFNVRKVPHL